MKVFFFVHSAFFNNSQQGCFRSVAQFTIPNWKLYILLLINTSILFRELMCALPEM